ncbi:bifunctional adenosylcobinamide kinase/adenosylcobinamide-phosphate guanylyltransferase [Hoyosella subflava]|uniref:Adenosylcobinamide kinase n=1 Tax=Hoyosella subflava (strain DSM 45089 / JCM 17490 / NBRC 109087 / DQS3-9A1) TaxID=443218 RepID=F6EEM4_HOYSD|nr:bifunctional adenosylcobinamide kinase/adenosylcobinamide-phosphate guanylyltransferase [Hoyosella subflava]AEF39721.1 Adenosyl cobinamide kinase/adenosyl cobinamide phosphate guanylyltransferase [Hoyosella subflava DQS3-9A1]
MGRVLVLGGARSGKSGHSEELIAVMANSPSEVRYIATSPPRVNDPEWEERIAVHRARRAPQWHTVETADVAMELRRERAVPTLVDDLGTWLTAQIDARQAWDGGPAALDDVLDDLVSAVCAYEGPLVIVTPEVGMGIVPPTRSGRMFRDLIGVLNSRLAEKCEKVVVVIAGIPLPLK